ncbi:MAG: type II toxin-antitoxin system RelB/DinJ family antitoxin [Acholeplasmatales bacterium]|nr:type II toxin-antitoxin system RelB/DinJ family antitoxin [Acholeplasmatales bacterium]
MTMLQIRVEEELKTQATLLFNELGLDLSTAIRLFLKKSLQVGGIPFDVRLSENVQKAMSAIESMRSKSEENGNSKMTLDEINEEIRLAREERKNIR